MKLFVEETNQKLGAKAAECIGEMITDAIAKKGKARIILSTGASQFEMFEHLVKMDISWDKVEMFHLDEYVDLPISHIASFRKYLEERFVSVVKPGAVYYVNGEGDIEKNIRELSLEIRKDEIDVGVIGIGENAHIAFNDPPADFDNQEAYTVVNLCDSCKRQQVGEGWFDTIDDVPNKAITMTVSQIMSCNSIVSVVPGKRKAQAIFDTLNSEKPDKNVPASILKEHSDWTLVLDVDSYSMMG